MPIIQITRRRYVFEKVKNTGINILMAITYPIWHPIMIICVWRYKVKTGWEGHEKGMGPF